MVLSISNITSYDNNFSEQMCQQRLSLNLPSWNALVAGLIRSDALNELEYGWNTCKQMNITASTFIKGWLHQHQLKMIGKGF